MSVATTPWQQVVRVFAASPFIQNSMVSPLPPCRFADIGTLTESLTPSKLKALPALPATLVTPPLSVPLLNPLSSTAFPSARHHAAAPEGTEVQTALPARLNGSPAVQP